MASAIINNKIKFLHLSKTGGWWCIHAMKQAGLKVDIIDLENTGGHIGSECLTDKEIGFGFVRHPILWYESLYNYMTKINWKFAPQLKAGNINLFIDNIMSGKHDKLCNLSKLTNKFYEKEKNIIIGKFEFLAFDLVSILKKLKLKCNYNKILQSRKNRINASDYVESMSVESMRKILKVDRRYFERFGYELF